MVEPGTHAGDEQVEIVRYAYPQFSTKEEAVRKTAITASNLPVTALSWYQSVGVTSCVQRTLPGSPNCN